MTTPRAHAKLAKLYFSDNEMKCWYWLTGEGRWIETDSPAFTHRGTYHVGKEAPTEPPQIMCELAGVKFPMPAQDCLGDGQKYFIPMMRHPDFPVEHKWKGSEADLERFSADVIHLTREGAEQHAFALIAANQQAIEKAKEQMK